jgi:predicted nucleotidyltransferase
MIKNTIKLANDTEINALEKVAKSLSAFQGVEKVVFFGSRVRGDFVGSSDMDLLIIITDIEIKNIVISTLHNIELEFDVPLSPVIFTIREYEINKKLKSSFIENVEREGIVIYDSKYKR